VILALYRILSRSLLSVDNFEANFVSHALIGMVHCKSPSLAVSVIRHIYRH